jgi:putative Mn2+ efflux pump MntP
VITVLALSVGLAADATAAAAGMGAAGGERGRLLQAATLFGLFQGGMLGLGAAGGAVASAWVEAIDHWIAFVLLVGIGGRAAWKAWAGGEEEESADGLPALILLAVATSLDAFAAGVAVPALGFPVLSTAAVVGAVTFVASGLGAALGQALGEAFGRRVQIAGGLLLCVIGIQAPIFG